MDTSDRKLIQAAKTNRAAFDALYRKYYAKVFNYFWYRVGHDEAVAEDLTQETFVRAYEALPRFKITTSSYLSYLLSIAHNLLVNHYRRPQPISLEATGVDVPEEIWSDIETKDNIRALWRAIQQLSPTEQDALYLTYRRGYRASEVAAIMGKTENAVKLLLSRARKKLKRHPYLEAISGFAEKKRRPHPGRYAKW